jgi:hypothetical protein
MTRSKAASSPARSPRSNAASSVAAASPACITGIAAARTDRALGDPCGNDVDEAMACIVFVPGREPFRPRG